MFKRHPLLLPLIGLVVGITSAGFLGILKNQAILLAGITLLILTALIFIESTRKSLSYFLLFAFLGAAITVFQDARFITNHFSLHAKTNHAFLAEIITAPTRTKKAVRLELELKKALPENRATSGKIFLYTPPDSALEQLLPGDKILFSANISPAKAPLNPNEFDYQNYLHLHQIYGRAYSTNVKLLPSTPTKTFLRYMAQLRSELFGYIKAMRLQPEEEAVAAALLLGYRHLLSDETQQAFSGSGAMHVLAVSGLHVGILYIITAFLLQMDKRKAHQNGWPKVLFALLIIWLYAALTGLSPSVSRAAVMFSIIAFGNLFWRKPATIQMIIASAIILLAYNPNYLFEVGFQLSYSAVFAIVYLQPKIYRLFKKPKHVLVDKTWQITSVSIAAQAGTFPLSLYYFHQFPVFFMISNLVVIPLAYILMNFGIFLLLLTAITTPPAFIISIFQILLSVMTGSVHAVESWPGAVLSGLHIGRIEMALLTLLVYFCAEAVFLRKKWALFLSTILAICLVFSFTAEAFFVHKKEQMIVYSIPNKTALEIRKGSSAIIIADEELLADEDAMLFYIRHNLWAGSIKNVLEFKLSCDTTSDFHQQKNGLIDAFGERFLLLKKSSDTTKFALSPTTIVVNKRIKAPKFVPKNIQLILMNGMSENTKKSWKTLANPIHDLEVDGAKQISIQPF